MVAAIRGADADLVCLQETTAASSEFLLRELGGAYPHAFFQPRDGRWLASGFGCLSRAALEARFVPKKNGLFGLVVVETDLGGRRVRALNVHLTPVMLDGEVPVMGVFAALEAMEDTHALEVGALEEHLDARMPTIVLGDLNSAPNMFAATALVARGLVDSYAAANPDDPSRPTWEWYVRGVRVELRLDYVLHSKHLRTVASEILDHGGSDHRPVVSTLAWAR